MVLWTKLPVWDEKRSRDVEWELFVGGDFNRMAELREEQNPNTARFVARCDCDSVYFLRLPSVCYLHVLSTGVY